jgi:photosystem II stability/assembly factor-like uncharacterized protein
MTFLRSLFLGLALVGAAISPTASSQERIGIAEVAHIHGIAFDPKDSSRVLLATHYGVFEALADGSAARVSSTRDDFMGFTTVPGRSDLLVASGHPETGGNLGFIASGDGGVTWRRVSEGAMGPVDFHALTVSPADPQVLYGLYRGIQSSRDGGQTWTLEGPGPDQVFDLAASPVDEDTLFAATGGGLQRSTDGGKSWSLVGPASPVTMVETGVDGTLYAFFAGAGLYSANAEATQWLAVNEELPGREFLHMASDPDDPDHLVAVTHASEVLESLDRGRTWAPFGSSSR